MLRHYQKYTAKPINIALLLIWNDLPHEYW